MLQAICFDALKNNYSTRAIITCGLYTFYPLFEVHLCTVTFLGLMYGQYLRAGYSSARMVSRSLSEFNCAKSKDDIDFKHFT